MASENHQPTASIALEPVATVPGLATAVEVVGDLAYVGLDHDLVVLSAGAEPRVIGGLRFGRRISDFAVQAGYAYIRLDKALAIVDASVPAQPKLVAELDLPPVDFRNGVPPAVAGDGGGRVVSNGHIAVAATFEGNPWGYERVIRLLVADVSSPSEPAWIASHVVHWTTVRLPGFDATLSDLVLDEHHVYLSYFYGTTYGPGPVTGVVSAMDLSAPSQPIEVGRHTTQDRATYALALDGDRLLVSLGLGSGARSLEPRPGLRVLDVADSSTLRSLGPDASYGHWIRDMTLVGHRTFAALGRDGVSILESAIDGRATEVARADALGDALRVDVAGNFVYVVAGTAGLHEYEMVDPHPPAYSRVFVPLCGASRAR